MNTTTKGLAPGCNSVSTLRTIVVMSCALLSACASITDTHGYKTKRYLGWLEVVEHQAANQPQPRIERVKALGLRFEHGFGVGYFDDSAITLPKNCHLIIVAKDIRQLNAFFEAYPQLTQQEMKPCVKPLDF